MPNPPAASSRENGGGFESNTTGNEYNLERQATLWLTATAGRCEKSTPAIHQRT